MENLTFLEDIYPENLLYAVTLRSPASNGVLKNIELPELPDNYTIITAKNIPGENRLEETEIPVLASKKLTYIGEPVAILLGPDKTRLEELARQCAVIFDANEELDSPAQITRVIQTGDIENETDKTGKVITGNYHTGIQDQWYAEPAGAITMYHDFQTAEAKTKKDKNKKHDLQSKQETTKIIHVKTATQWPYHVKRSVARTLGIDQSLVTVEPTALSLHMDGKLLLPSLIACQAALGTFITGKPVRFILNRQEDFLFSPKRCESDIKISTVISDEGEITSADIEITVNLDNNAVNGQEILDQHCIGILGIYNLNNLKLTATVKRNNIPPQGPFCGFGLAQSLFAVERHISQIADSANHDPASWRKNHTDFNLLIPTLTSQKNTVSIETLIETTVSMSDYYRKWASYELLRHDHPVKKEYSRGIGIALGFQGNDLLNYGEDNGVYSVEATLTKEGTLVIKACVTCSDNDYDRLWAKVASQILSIEPDLVHTEIYHNEHGESPDCGPSCASRNITSVTKLVEKCCYAIRKQRFHDPLPITVRRQSKPVNGTLLKGKFPPPAGTSGEASRGSRYMNISGFVKPSQICAVVEVSIDLIECIPRIRGIWLGIDGGRIISKNRSVRSINRSVTQALGWAFSEDIKYTDGILPVNQYDNFVYHSPLNIPPVEIKFLTSGTEDPKGIGELPFTCIPAAFLQAVSQAMNNSFTNIPINRKDIWEIIRTRNSDMQLQGQK